MALASEMLRQKDTVATRTMASCAAAMMDFYILLDCPTWDAEQRRESCRRFCVLYASLSKHYEQEGLWAMKPKIHLFQELAEFQAPDLGHPGRFWAYKDEDFVGQIAKMAASRGGPKSASTTARHVLNRYRVWASY